jgi:hypothetical protein
MLIITFDVEAKWSIKKKSKLRIYKESIVYILSTYYSVVFLFYFLFYFILWYTKNLVAIRHSVICTLQTMYTQTQFIIILSCYLLYTSWLLFLTIVIYIYTFVNIKTKYCVVVHISHYKHIPTYATLYSPTHLKFFFKYFFFFFTMI